MAFPQVELTNSFNEWRILTNDISTNVGDPTDIVPDQAATITDLVSALNDVYTKKYNRTGGAISGAVTMGSTLGVTGATTLTSATLSTTLGVTGATTLTSAALSTTLSVAGTSTLAAISGTSLSVTGDSAFGSNVTLTGSDTAATEYFKVKNGSAVDKFVVDSASGNTTISGTLSATGATTLASTLAVTGDLSINTNKFNVVAASGNTTIAGTLGVSDTATFSKSIISTLGTLTASTPILSATQTWNNSGVAFSGIYVNVTNTASSATSLLLDFRLAGVTKFGVEVDGTVKQQLSGNNLARDIVSGTRHIREYQDLNDANTQGLDAAYNEWGFTWNAGWNGSSYDKDRSLANDHALMTRTNNAFKEQWWFSDGTTPGSAISWVKKVEFDFPNSTYWFDGAMTVNALTTANLITTGQVNVGTVSSFADYEVTLATMVETIIATVDATVYRSATFEVQAFNSISGFYHKTLISAVHNGTTAQSVEYGVVAVDGVCGTFTVTLAGGNMYLKVTSTNANSTVYKIHSRLMKV